MKLRKNLQAKLGVGIAAILGLLMTWGLVHSNPPPASAGSAADPVATPAAPAQPSSKRQQPRQSSAPSQRTHTRTRAS